jgi:hypothetical protein
MAARTYRYVGPDSIRSTSFGSPPGTVIRSGNELHSWVRQAAGSGGLTATFIVNLDGELVLAPRESEHVAAAQGEPVLAAGEISFAPDGDVVEATNQSTGYCPEPGSWHHVAAALDRLAGRHPPDFTTAFEFRRCEACSTINLVKDAWYVCSVCDGPLPTTEPRLARALLWRTALTAATKAVVYGATHAATCRLSSPTPSITPPASTPSLTSGDSDDADG